MILNKKVLPMLLLASSLLLVACGGGSSGSDTSGGDTSGGDTSGGLTFSLKGMTKAYTTNTAQTDTKSTKSTKSIDASGNSLLPVFADYQQHSVRDSADEARHTHSTKTTGSFNMIAINEKGTALPAYTSSDPVRVMFSARAATSKTSRKDSDVTAKNELYVALSSKGPAGDTSNYATFISEQNCAIFRVSLDDNSYKCLLSGVEAAPIHGNDFGKFDGSGNKSIQFDELGNIYIQGFPFTSGSNQITKSTISRLYKVSVSDYSVSTLTQDNEDVGFFSVLKSGEAIVLLKRTNGNDLVMITKSSGRLSLSTGGADYFVNKDTYRTVMYGSSSIDNKIRFVRSSDSGMERTALDYSAELNKTYNGSTYNTLVPQRIMVADDGYVYVAYSAEKTSDSSQALLVYQLLPFKKEIITTIPVTGNWWSWMQNRPIQVKKGILYYVEQVDLLNVGKADVVSMVRLRDGEKVRLFATGDRRYRIDSWKARGDLLFFSGIDLSANMVVQGAIDTKKVAQQVDWTASFSTCYTVTASSSASLSSAIIEDIEILSPQQPFSDPGMNPNIQDEDQESTARSSYLPFTKYMDREKVESSLTMKRDADASNITYFPVWVYQNLHLIYDTSLGLGDDETTGIPSNTGGYTLSLGQVQDAYDWQLEPKSYTYNSSATFPSM